jgi:hypothetical protein
MTNLRERLQAGDPARTARPLDPEEVAAIRHAMAAVRPEPRGGRRAAGLALAATGLAALLLLFLWPATAPGPTPVPPPTPQPEPVAEVAPAPVVPAPVVADVRARERRRAVPAPPPAEPAQVKEIRFVTASGTQILWTVRSSEEGA